MQVSFQIDFLFDESQFLPYVITVNTYGTCRYADESGDLFGGFSLTDKIGHLHLPGSETEVFRG